MEDKKNLSLCSEQSQPRVLAARHCQTAVKSRARYKPIKYPPLKLNLDAELLEVAQENETPSSLSILKNLPDNFDLNEELPLENVVESVRVEKENKVVSATPRLPKIEAIEKEIFPTPTCTLKTPFRREQPIEQKKILYSTDANTINRKAPGSKKVLFTALPERREILTSETKESKVQHITVNGNAYKVLFPLGRGGSSIVLHCYDITARQDYAIKCVNLDQDPSAVTSFVSEVKTLKRLQHCSRVVKLYDYQILQDQKKLYMVLEKGSRDLSSVLKELAANSTTHLPVHKLFYYWIEMLYAVQEIHANGVIHSDLKPANFIESRGTFKLIDFGIASCVQKDMTSVVKNVTLGTFSYISPEALHNDRTEDSSSPNFKKPKFKISYKSDVWSLGCILYQLIYRRTPFQHIGHTWAKIAAIMDPEHQIDYPAVAWAPPILIDTIKSCLRHDMRSRPSIDDLIDTFERIYFK